MPSSSLLSSVSFVSLIAPIPTPHTKSHGPRFQPLTSKQKPRSLVRIQPMSRTALKHTKRPTSSIRELVEPTSVISSEPTLKTPEQPRKQRRRMLQNVSRATLLSGVLAALLSHGPVINHLDGLFSPFQWVLASVAENLGEVQAAHATIGFPL